MLSHFHRIPEHDGRTDKRTELLYQYCASVNSVDRRSSAGKLFRVLGQVGLITLDNLSQYWYLNAQH